MSSNFETSTAKIQDGIPYCAFCEDKMILAHEETTPNGFNLKAYICDRCFSSYVQGNSNDTYLQFYDRLASSFAKIWRKSKK